MMPGWLQPKERAIEHVRQPGQRMPIRNLEGCEGPLHPRPGKAVLHHHVLGDVKVIVVVDEVMMGGRVIDDQRDRAQNQRKQYCALTFGSEELRWRTFS